MVQKEDYLPHSASASPSGEGRSPASKTSGNRGEARGEVVVIKIGGNIIDNEAALQQFLRDVAALPDFKVLVHGGGKLATQLAADLKVPQQMINGRRVTDAASLKIVTMVYAGDINKRIVAGLQAQGANAIGLCGADANIVRAQKRTGTDTDYGFVGDVVEGGVDAGMLMRLLQAGLTPVIAPITHDGAGELLNTNADTMANEIATALAAHTTVQLIYCFEKNGVLMNPDDDASVISRINPDVFAQLKNDGIVTAGMIPKIENALAAVAKGVSGVVIGRAEALAQLLDGSAGTTIKNTV